MLQASTIRSFATSLLLVLAVIGFVPKSLVHDAIATHVDSTGCEHPKWDGPCLHEQRFHCHANDLVVSSPYTFGIATFTLTAPATFAVEEPDYISYQLLHRHSGTEGRGPPQMIA